MTMPQTESTKPESPAEPSVSLVIARRFVDAAELARRATRNDDWEAMGDRAYEALALLPDRAFNATRQLLKELTTVSHPYCPCGCMEARRKQFIETADRMVKSAIADLERTERALYRPLKDAQSN